MRYDPAALGRTLAEAEFRHDVRPDDVVRVLRRGHPGSATLRAALEAHATGHGAVKSRLERRFRELLVRHGVELPARNQPVGPWVVDCVWRDRRVVVELDGRQHARPHQADTDDDRDLWLRRNRYVPRRYGTKQVDQRPGAVTRTSWTPSTRPSSSATPMHRTSWLQRRPGRHRQGVGDRGQRRRAGRVVYRNSSRSNVPSARSPPRCSARPSPQSQCN